MIDSNLYIARVLSADSASKDIAVLIHRLQGDTPIFAQAYVNSDAELSTRIVPTPGDRVLIFFDGGNTNSQAYWMTTSQGGTGGGGGGDMEGHLAAPDPHPQYVLAAGDTLSGALSGITPTSAAHLTRKDYVDGLINSLLEEIEAIEGDYYTQEEVNNIVANYLHKAGGTMSGFITLHSNPTADMHPVTKILFDNHLNASNPHPDIQVALGSSTTGSYVATIAGTANQVTVTGSGSETAAVTLSLPQSIHTAATPTFASLTLSQASGTPPLVVNSSTAVANLNADLLDGQHGSYYNDWGNLANKPSPSVGVSLTGAVTGTDSITWTGLGGNVSLSIATTITGGPGSNLDADTLDGQHGSFYQNADNLNAGAVPTARLTGPYSFDLTGTLTGNASTATALQTPRTIAGKTFDGTQNVTLEALTAGNYIAAGGTYTGAAARTFDVDATTTATASKVVARDGAGDIAAAVVNSTRLTSSIATGTAPLTVSSTTVVTNLNADLLDGNHASAFASSEELEALLGDLFYVGLYDAESYDYEDSDATKPKPQWSEGPDVYRHAMYWVVASTGQLDFIDADLSGRYDIDDDTATVANGDWIIAIKNPDLGSPVPGEDLALSDVVFQFIPFSAETFVKAQINVHSDDPDHPHAAAGYLRQGDTDLLYSVLTHDHDPDINAAIAQHGQRISYSAIRVTVEDGIAEFVLQAGDTNFVIGGSASVIGEDPLDWLNGTYPVAGREVTDLEPFYDEWGALNDAELRLDGDLTNTGTATITEEIGGAPVFVPMSVAGREDRDMLARRIRYDDLATGTGGERSVAMVIYVPELDEEAEDPRVVGLWSKGASGQGWGCFVSDYTLVLVKATSSVAEEIGTYELPGPGFYTVGGSIGPSGSPEMVLYVNGAPVISEVGTGNTGGDFTIFGSCTTGTPDGYDAINAIDGSGILISHVNWVNEVADDDWFLQHHIYSLGRSETVLLDVEGMEDGGADFYDNVIVTSEPHPYYVLQSDADLWYASVDHNHDGDIADALLAHTTDEDPHPQYFDQSRGDNRYESAGAVTEHVALPNPHGGVYYTKQESDILFDVAGAVQAHEDEADPHPQYLLLNEGNEAYAPKVHDHNNVYYTKTEIGNILAEATTAEVLATDGAASARVFIGDETPADPQPGDLWVVTENVALQEPNAPAALALIPLSDTEIRIQWGSWPAASSLQNVVVQMSTTGGGGTYSTVSPGPSNSDLSYVVDGLDEDVQYWFRVAGTNAASSGVEDEWQWGYVNAFTQNLAPPPPTDAVISDVEAYSFRMSWDAPAWPDEGGSGARYEVALVGTTPIGFAAGTDTHYDFTGLSEVTSYIPKVRAVDRGGLRSEWLTANVSTGNDNPPPPGSIGTLDASTTAPKVSATWTAHSTIADFSHYEVQLIRDDNSAVLHSTTTTGLAWTSPETAFGTDVRVRVRTVDSGGLASDWVTSDAETTKADVVVSPASSGGTPNDSFTVTWSTVTGLDNFSGYVVQLWRGEEAVATVDLNTAATSYTWNSLNFGATYRAIVRVKRSAGTAPEWSASSTSRVMVADPIPGRTAAGSGNSITGTITAPGTVPTGLQHYRIELQTAAGGAVSAKNQSAGAYSFTGLSYSTGYRVRVRAERTNGHHSSWSTFASATTGAHPDTTPPVLPTGVSVNPVGGYGVMVGYMTWPGGADHHTIEILRQTNGGSWTAIYTGSTRHTSVGLGTFGAGTSIRMACRSRDSYGNWSGYVYSNIYTLAASPTLVQAGSTNFWRNTWGGEYMGDGTDRPIQGYHTTAANNAIGMIYYGNGIYNACQGKTVTNITLTLHRYNGGGNNVQDGVQLGWHSIGTNPGDVSGVGPPSVWEISQHTTLAWNESKEFNVSAAIRNAFISGSARGFGMYAAGGKPYIVFSSRGANQFQGWVRVYHYG